MSPRVTFAPPANDSKAADCQATNQIANTFRIGTCAIRRYGNPATATVPLNHFSALTYRASVALFSHSAIAKAPGKVAALITVKIGSLCEM